LLIDLKIYTGRVTKQGPRNVDEIEENQESRKLGIVMLGIGHCDVAWKGFLYV
jgi:hypothetical protein